MLRLLEYSPEKDAGSVAMDYLDFDLEIGRINAGNYPLTLHNSPTGNARASLVFPFDATVQENYLLKLQQALNSGPVKRRLPQPHEQAVQEFGQRLFDALFTGELHTCYQTSLQEANQQGKGLRFKLRITDPGLAILPWEYLYDSSQGEYLCLSYYTPLVRYLDLPHPPRPLAVQLPLRILGMVASPSDQDLLDVEGERSRMQVALSGLIAQGLVELTWLSGQTARDLQREMHQPQPWHIFHFIGHSDFDAGRDEGVVALANEAGKTHLVQASDFRLLLADQHSLRLVILNSCKGGLGSQLDLFSSVASTLVQRGLPAVLAMQADISDRAATEFTRAFYEALADGLPVDGAVVEARKAIRLGIPHTLEWGTPVLYLRAPDGELFHLSGEPQKTKEQWVKEGDDHKQAGRYDEALGAYERALQLETDDAKAWDNKGDAFFKLKRFEEALVAFEDALKLDPQLAYAWHGKGNTLNGLGRYVEALVAFERALKLDPQLAYAWHGKGNVLRNLLRYEEALEAYERAVELVPKDAKVWYSKGKTLTDLQRYEEALEAYEQAVGLDPKDATAWNAKGHVLACLKRYAEALVAFEEALELTPQQEIVWFNKGIVLGNLQCYEEALEAYEQAVGLDPKHSVAWNEMGLTLGYLRRYEEALEAHEHALQLNSSYVDAWACKGGTLNDLRRYEEALPAFERALELDPKDAVALNGKGNALMRLGRTAEAVQVYKASQPPALGTTLITYRGHAKYVKDADWSPDGKYIASGSDDGTVQIWEATTGLHLMTYRNHTGEVMRVAWSPNGRYIASGGGRSPDYTVQVWNPSTGEHLLTLKNSYTNWISGVAWSPDSQRLASCESHKKTVEVREATTGKYLLTYTGHTDFVRGLAWSPDGKYIASGSSDKTVQIWEATTGKHFLTYTGHSSYAWEVAWSPDGKYIASGSDDGTVQIWEATTGKCSITFAGHTGHLVHAVKWSPDGQLIASESQIGMKVFEAMTGQTLNTYQLGALLAWSPDGMRIASTGGDGVVVWQAR